TLLPAAPWTPRSLPRKVNARSYSMVETYTPFFLTDGGSLSRSAAVNAGQDQLTWVPRETASGSLEFVREAFASGAMLAGPLAARLEVESSNTNLQLLVEVLDRAPLGTTARISHGSILGSLRKKDPAKSWADANGLPIRPYLALNEEQPLTPNAATQLDVPLWPTVWSIEPGHRVVVRISIHAASAECSAAIGTPPVGCNLTAPMQATLPGGVYKLHRSPALRSLVNLPLLPYGSLPTSKSAVSPTGGGLSVQPLPIDW
ncbi:MAG TPA: CocE/NonD family hydrolase C-terminal non-catalytic domain-containing protein, partial [Polyangiaceae bacterium]|nr:CocE/NonD family hydrolase C-terminal non-catalytic domain-containing protein [Polyangiaceae bacterium]